MNELKIGKWYNITTKENTTWFKKDIKWQYCGEILDGHLFQRFNVDYVIPFAEADLFTFYEEPPRV